MLMVIAQNVTFMAVACKFDSNFHDSFVLMNVLSQGSVFSEIVEAGLKLDIFTVVKC